MQKLKTKKRLEKKHIYAGETAYNKIMENIDASKEPATDWKTSAKLTPAWPAAVPSAFVEGGSTSAASNQTNHNHNNNISNASVAGRDQLVAKMARPLVVQRLPAAQVEQNKSHPTSFFVDFEREFQGGVVLTVGGEAGCKVLFLSFPYVCPEPVLVK